MFFLYAPYPTINNCNWVMATPALVLLKCKYLKSTQVTASAMIMINIEQKYGITTYTLLKSQQITMSILYQSPSPWVFFTRSTLTGGCTFTCCRSPTIQIVQSSQSSYQTPKLSTNMYVEEEYRLKNHTECLSHSSSWWA